MREKVGRRELDVTIVTFRGQKLTPPSYNCLQLLVPPLLLTPHWRRGLSLLDSVTRFETKLNEAIFARQWRAADRSVDRLRAALLEALVKGDAEAISRIEAAFSNARQIVELRDRLKLADDAVGMAHRLRADTGSAVLAGRMRPLPPTETDPIAAGTLRDKILDTLRQSNRPMTNSDLCQRLGKDAPAISRGLKTLSLEGCVRQWRAGSQRLNALTEKGRGRIPPIESLIAAKELVTGGPRLTHYRSNEGIHKTWPKSKLLHAYKNSDGLISRESADAHPKTTEDLSSNPEKLSYASN